VSVDRFLVFGGDFGKVYDSLNRAIDQFVLSKRASFRLTLLPGVLSVSKVAGLEP